MGKQSKTKTKTKTNKQDIYVEEKPCDICFDTMFARHLKQESHPDNGTACPNAHTICMECVKKLIKPKIYFCNDQGDRREECCGFCYRCPLCREDACVDRYQLFAIMKSSHKVARKEFILCDEELDDEISQAFQQLTTWNN